MRKSLLLVVVLLSASSAALFAAQFNEMPFVPLDPEIMGRGGSSVADAHGYESFFYNPAGFSRGTGSFSLSSSMWIHARPDQFLNLLVGSKSQTDILTFLNEQVTTGGFGMGASTGIGYVGNGLGLGFVMMADSMMYGPSLLGLTGDLTATAGFIGGLSVPIDVGNYKIHVGGDVRPMIRMHTLLSNSDAIAVITALSSGGSLFGALSPAATVYGVGFALDFGAIAELGWFTVGLSIRDLGGTQFTYNQNSFGTVMNSLGSALKFPPGTAVTDQYVIPMDVALGLGFHPDLGTVSQYVDPSFNMDLHDLFGTLGGTKSVWTLLHLGAEVRLISLFNLALGLDSGYFTFGAGIKLLVFEWNFAVFTQELGAYIGDRPSSGASINLSVRW
ncbi:MAG: hypothetical protein ABSG63_06950 [Spirochaetia bacterium]